MPMTELMAFWICHFVLTLGVGFLLGYCHEKSEHLQRMEDLNNMICYLDPDGSKREVGRVIRTHEFVKLTKD